MNCLVDGEKKTTSATIDVAKPTVNIVSQSIDDFEALDDGNNWGIILKGVRAAAQVIVPDGFTGSLLDGYSSGEFGFAQIVTPSRTYTHLSNAVDPNPFNGHTGLDTRFPYSHFLYDTKEYAFGLIKTGSDKTGSFYDSPGIGAGHNFISYITLEYFPTIPYGGNDPVILAVLSDAFETYIVFKPPGDKSITIALEKMRWGYYGVGTPAIVNGTTTPPASAKSIAKPYITPFEHVTQQPEWTEVIKEGGSNE